MSAPDPALAITRVLTPAKRKTPVPHEQRSANVSVPLPILARLGWEIGDVVGFEFAADAATGEPNGVTLRRIERSTRKRRTA